MKRLRLKVSEQDRDFVLVQGSTRRRFKPFAHAFGNTRRASEANAALIVKAVNCHTHMVLALQAIRRMTQRPVNGNGARLQRRIALIARRTTDALLRVGV